MGKRVLVAGSAADVELFTSALSGIAEVCPATTQSAVLALAAGKPDLIACGIHFDDSSMFDVLVQLKSDEDLRAIDVLCFRTQGGKLAPFFSRAMEVSAREAGAAGYIDIFALGVEMDTEAARRHVRDAVVSLIGEKKQASCSLSGS
jgi:CheY-like chemotaxis protein